MTVFTTTRPAGIIQAAMLQPEMALLDQAHPGFDLEKVHQGEELLFPELCHFGRVWLSSLVFHQHHDESLGPPKSHV